MTEAVEKKPAGRWSLSTIVRLVLIVLALIVIFQNTESVETKLLFWTISMPRVVLLAIMLAIGFVAGWFTRRRRK